MTTSEPSNFKPSHSYNKVRTFSINTQSYEALEIENKVNRENKNLLNKLVDISLGKQISVAPHKPSAT